MKSIILGAYNPYLYVRIFDDGVLELYDPIGPIWHRLPVNKIAQTHTTVSCSADIFKHIKSKYNE